MRAPPVVATLLPDLPPPCRGKVRDLYEPRDLEGSLLLVATDRLSAYDHVLEPGIPDKGKILTQLSSFWFERLAGLTPHHLLATEVADFLPSLQRHREILAGRAVLARRTEVVPFEFVARGYLAGSGYREYRATGRVCGFELGAGLERADRLPEPIFTPATKAETGHDENIDFATLVAVLGGKLARRLRDLTLALYAEAAAFAADRGLILADTKFEFGRLPSGELLLIDEALTPDSSRYWDSETWRPGKEPVSFDKQYVRNWLDASGWDHESPPPALPPEVVEETRERYLEAYRRITGEEPRL